jgi:hypothetical protein
MKTLAARRRVSIAAAVAVIGLLWLAHAALALAFYPVARTGWLLLGMVLFLAAYNARKKLPFLPLGTAALWLQLHIYVGLVAVFAFGLHVSWRLPRGIFEAILAVLFVTVAASGVVGLILSRVLAPRMTTRGGEVLWDRIGRMRSMLGREAERLALECLAKTESPAIAEYYLRRLRPFFARPRNFFHHLFQSRRPRQVLAAEIDAQRRYLNDAEREYIAQVEQCVLAKDDLDYQFALQATLKGWLFVHVPLTYALIVFAAAHVLLVYSF